MYTSVPRYSESAPGSGNIARKSDHSRKYGQCRRRRHNDLRRSRALGSRQPDPPQSGGLTDMAGAMRKMAVYLGLMEDNGYDEPGIRPR